jgi:hypothetical protein
MVNSILIIASFALRGIRHDPQCWASGDSVKNKRKINGWAITTPQELGSYLSMSVCERDDNASYFLGKIGYP